MPFLVRPERIEVHAEVQAAKADAVVSTDTFGWRVLQTLADDVAVQHDAGPTATARPSASGWTSTPATCPVTRADPEYGHLVPLLERYAALDPGDPRPGRAA